jgi:hypothetical protein
LRPYRYNPAQKGEIESQIQDMLSKGWIQPSCSPYSSPVLLVRKKTGDWRLCVDYRRLNALTVKNKYPLPIVEELLEELQGASWFTTLDLCSGFHQIRIAPGDEEKTAFQTHSGHYEYRVMPYGVTGGPATFQGIMNTILASLLRKCAVVFIDDILIYSKTWSEHLEHIQAVLSLLLQHQFQVKMSKCTFAKQQLCYLGHIVSSKGVATDPTKIQIIQKWPKPENVKDLRSFLGMAGYYRRFVSHFGLLAKPLTNLLKKGIMFIWTSETESAFQALKQALTQAPILALPDFSLPFTIETDASGKGIGAVLQQQGHPIAFASKALGIKAQCLSTYEKECLAILMAVDHWYHYLQCSKFNILTDQQSLTSLDAQRLSTPWQHKALTKLMGLDYKILYKKGADNKVADALSRVPTDDKYEIAAISTVKPLWLQEIQSSYTDPSSLKLLSELSITSSQGHYQLTDGLLRYKGRIWIGPNEQLKTKILHALHSSAIGGHSGFEVTYKRIKHLFAWSGMKQFVKTFVSQCTTCQQAKVERVAYPGLLAPLPIPKGAWQVITMDFIEGLPRSASFNCILVVVDKYSKYAHFLPLSHPFTALDVALVFMHNIFKLHGLPTTIISDRDKIFTSALWQEFFDLLKTDLHMSSAYHPQTDGQTERVNQCLETYLRCFVQACPTKWSKWLSLAEYWYNTSYHSSLGHSPFLVLYGYEPRHFGIDLSQAVQHEDIKNWLEQRDLMHQLVRHHLIRAQNKMKAQADKHRSFRSFSVGDSVYLKVQPYVQTSLAPRSSNKLSFKYFGPFKDIEKIGPSAYKLKLPEGCLIHPVFHVSLLKQAVPPSIIVSKELPDPTNQLQVPISILDRRLRQHHDTMIPQVLVRWSYLPEDLCTWENELPLRQQFPHAPAWGQAGSEGRGDVTVATTDRRMPVTEASEGRAKDGNQLMGSERPPRKRRPNTRLAGSEWAK